MKTLSLAPGLALGFALIGAPALAETIPPQQAAAHVGQTVTVEGTASEVHHAASGRAILIDIGGRYPDNAFVVVIFARDAHKFPGVDALGGKTVDVTGAVRLYNGKPEIIVDEPRQIETK